MINIFDKHKLRWRETQKKETFYRPPRVCIHPTLGKDHWTYAIMLEMFLTLKKSGGWARWKTKISVAMVNGGADIIRRPSVVHDGNHIWCLFDGNRIFLSLREFAPGFRQQSTGTKSFALGSIFNLKLPPIPNQNTGIFWIIGSANEQGNGGFLDCDPLGLLLHFGPYGFDNVALKSFAFEWHLYPWKMLGTNLWFCHRSNPTDSKLDELRRGPTWELASCDRILLR